jgi:serine/threonine-protein kinase
LAALAASSLARAQSASDKAAAEALFDEGKRLLDAKRYAEACPKLADSQRLDPGVGTLLNLALCYKLNGQTASAWSTYREAAAQARTARQEEREQLARDEAAELEKVLTRLVVEVSPEAAAIPGLEIKRDGAPVLRGLWGVPIPVDPGVRKIAASAPGRKTLLLDARAEGAGATAKLVIPALEAGDETAAPPVVAATAPVTPAPAPAPAPAPPPGEPSDGSGQRTAGWIIGGVGAVGVVTAVIVGLVSRAQSEAADKSSGSQRADYRDGAETTKTIAFVSAGVGVAALTTGIILLATAPSKPEAPPSAGLFLVPSLSERELGARLTGRF